MHNHSQRRVTLRIRVLEVSPYLEVLVAAVVGKRMRSKRARRMDEEYANEQHQPKRRRATSPTQLAARYHPSEGSPRMSLSSPFAGLVLIIHDQTAL